MIIDDTYGYGGIRLYEDACPTLRAGRQGLLVLEPFIIDYRGKLKQELTPKEIVPCLRAEAHGNHPLVFGEVKSTYKEKEKEITMNGFTVNDFFCGAGGMGLGFKNAGFEIKGAWDFDKYAVESYKRNVGDHVEQADISKMDYWDIPVADVWTFGFPCQDLSVAGKQAGMIKGVTRSGLFYEVMRLLHEVEQELGQDMKPKVIMAENVKALKKYLPVLQEEYEAAGYQMVHTLFNSKYWGVPQNRERYFVVGVRNDIAKSFRFPEQQADFIPKLSSILEENVDEKYYISDEKATKIIEQAKNKVELKDNHPCITPDRVDKRQNGRRAKEEEAEMFTLTAQDLHGIIVVGKLDQPGHDMRKRVYDPEGISPTVQYARASQEPKVFLDYCVRKLTPREYARLQGFPDSYEQVVSNSQFYKQMGNAVTVNVAEAIAEQLKIFLEGE